MGSDTRWGLTTRRAVLAGTAGFALWPAAAAQAPSTAPGNTPEGKPDLRVMTERPLNAEATPALLEPDVTPTAHHFVRNNGKVPERALRGSLDGWTLTVEGEVGQPMAFTLPMLKDLPEHQAQLVIECGGNGRGGFRPAASGTQWTLGAVGCAHYRGVRLADVLEAVGVKQQAKFVAYYGEDPALSGEAGKVPISRGCSLDKALDGHTMLAFEMNGEPLPALHGFPLRLIVPGYPGSASGKWLTRLWVRRQIHDGPKMTGSSYRVPRYPVAPGTPVDDADMVIIEQMPVKSVMTAPQTGMRVPVGAIVEVRGHAWSGAGDVRAVDLSTDFGATWQPATVQPAPNRYAWQRFTATLPFSRPGHYEVWARATDEAGLMQPMVVPGWNPKGYLNNAMHRIAIQVMA